MPGPDDNVRDDLPREVLRRVRSCLPALAAIPLHEPTFRGREREYVGRCIDTGWVSTAGSYVDEFEARLVDLTGARHAIATVNGTAALHVCLRLAGVAANDEVIVPALTFVATANAVSYCHAVPHFADVSGTTLGLDPDALARHLADTAERRGQDCVNRRTGRRLRAVVPMHTFGHPVDMDALVPVCAEFGLTIVEDAAESLGSRYRGRHTGTMGTLAALSFNGNKIVTTGGGGAVLTDSPRLARAARHLTTTARLASGWEFVHDEVGYNYRMPNLNAALGLAQIERLTELVSSKRALAARYRAAFADYPHAQIFAPPSFAESNHWLTALLIVPSLESQRDAVLQALNDDGIGARPAWRLMHTLPMYRHCPRMDLPVAESLERRIVNLPGSAHLAPTHPPRARD